MERCKNIFSSSSQPPSRSAPRIPPQPSTAAPEVNFSSLITKTSVIVIEYGGGGGSSTNSRTTALPTKSVRQGANDNHNDNDENHNDNDDNHNDNDNPNI